MRRLLARVAEMMGRNMQELFEFVTPSALAAYADAFRSQGLLRAGDVAAALQLLQGAVEKAPRRAMLRHLYANALWQSDALPLAEREARVATSLSGRNWVHQDLLGRILFASGQHVAAVERLHVARELSGGRVASIHYWLGCSLNEIGARTEARAAWEAAALLSRGAVHRLAADRLREFPAP